VTTWGLPDWPAADLFSRYDSGTAARKGIKDDRTAPRAVAHCVRVHRDRLHGRMHLELVHPAGSETRHAGVTPHVGSRPAARAKAKIVQVRRAALLEHEDEFVLRAIKTALSPVAFDPNAKVLQLVEDRETGSEQLADVPPIHEHIGDRPIRGVVRAVAKRLLEKAGELGRTHLA